MVSFREGWSFSGGLGNYGAKTLSMLSKNMLIASIVKLLMPLPTNRTVLVDDFQTSDHDLFPNHLYQDIVWCTWSGVRDLWRTCPWTHYKLLTWHKTWHGARPLTPPAMLAPPQGNVWASQSHITPSHHNPPRGSPASNSSSRGGGLSGRGNIRGGRK